MGHKPDQSVQEARQRKRENVQDRRRVDSGNKQLIKDSLDAVEEKVAASNAEQEVKDALLELKEVVRETNHIQTGDDRFDPDA